jgi:phage terminase large subunit-like protein
MTAVLAVDPGRTTGLAWCDSIATLGGKMDERVGGLVSHTQVTGDDTTIARRIVAGAERIDARVIVMESFQLRPGVALKGADALAPVKIAAMVDVLLGRTFGGRCVLMYQTASQGKSVMTDVRMKAVGCWWKGEPHAVDAGRHLLTFVRRVRSGKVKLPEGLWE